MRGEARETHAGRTDGKRHTASSRETERDRGRKSERDRESVREKDGTEHWNVGDTLRSKHQAIINLSRITGTEQLLYSDPSVAPVSVSLALTSSSPSKSSSFSSSTSSTTSSTTAETAPGTPRAVPSRSEQISSTVNAGTYYRWLVPPRTTTVVGRQRGHETRLFGMADRSNGHARLPHRVVKMAAT